MRIPKSKILYFCFCFILFPSNDVKSQEYSSIIIGIGLPELLHLGYHTSSNPLGVGVSAGMATLETYCINGDISLIFKKSRSKELSSWYTKTGFSWFRDGSGSRIYHDYILDWRLGKYWKFASHNLLFLDLGLSVIVAESSSRKVEVMSGWNLNFDFTGAVFPSLSIRYHFALDNQ